MSFFLFVTGFYNNLIVTCLFQALIVARQEKENLEMQRNRLQHKCKDLGEDFRLRLIKYIEDISVSAGYVHNQKTSQSARYL